MPKKFTYGDRAILEPDGSVTLVIEGLTFLDVSSALDHVIAAWDCFLEDDFRDAERYVGLLVQGAGS